MKKEDIQISLHENTLTVSGERKQEQRGQGRRRLPQRAVLRPFPPQRHPARPCPAGQREGPVQGGHPHRHPRESRGGQAETDRSAGLLNQSNSSQHRKKNPTHEYFDTNNNAPAAANGAQRAGLRHPGGEHPRDRRRLPPRGGDARRQPRMASRSPSKTASSPSSAAAPTRSCPAPRVYRESRPLDYRRVFDLDPSIDTGRITAKMEQGILTLTLPKAEQVKPRRIQVTD